MVKIDMERSNLSKRIYNLLAESAAAWEYASTKDPASMAGDMAESAAIETGDLAQELIDEYLRRYGCLPQGITEGIERWVD